MSNPISQYSMDTQVLLNAILAQAPDAETAAALLVGSYGESNWNPYAVSDDAYGAFQFTPPGSYGPGSEVGASASAQVAAILSDYAEARERVPACVTNPAARAEYQALASERPEYDTDDMARIEATNAPTTYGANFSYSVQNWDEIVPILATRWGTRQGDNDVTYMKLGTDWYRTQVYAGPVTKGVSMTVWHGIAAADVAAVEAYLASNSQQPLIGTQGILNWYPVVPAA